MLNCQTARINEAADSGTHGSHALCMTECILLVCQSTPSGITAGHVECAIGPPSSGSQTMCPIWHHNCYQKICHTFGVLMELTLAICQVRIYAQRTAPAPSPSPLNCAVWRPVASESESCQHRSQIEVRSSRGATRIRRDLRIQSSGRKHMAGNDVAKQLCETVVSYGSPTACDHGKSS